MANPPLTLPKHVTKLTQNFRTFHGHVHRGNVDVLNFRNEAGWSLDEIRTISNGWSKHLQTAMARPNLTMQMSVGVKFNAGYKSSTHLTNAGEDVDIWGPNPYNPTEEEVTNYEASRPKTFDIYLMARPTEGGCSKTGSKAAITNDCLFDALVTLTANTLPSKINTARKLKTFFGVERNAVIPCDPEKMAALEALMRNCNINIIGDVDYVSQAPAHRHYRYTINLKAGHYEETHNPYRQVLGYKFRNERPFIIRSGDTLFDGVECKKYDYTSSEFLKKQKNCVFVDLIDRLGWEGTMKKYEEDNDALKDATSFAHGYRYQLNLKKALSFKDSILTLFMHSTFGMEEPAPIDGIEGKLLKWTQRGGLVFAHPYTGVLYKYDWVSRYASVMMSTKCIPMKPGAYCTITQAYVDALIEKKHTPKYGFYHCKVIASADGQINKLFGWNRRQWYTHEDLELAIRLGLNIDVIGDKNNAYLYDRSSLKPLREIFGPYISYVFPLKQQYVPFAKSYLTMLWGTLQKYRKHTATFTTGGETEVSANWKELYFEKINDDSYKITYEDTVQPFVYNWGRIGTFLTSMARNKLGKFLLHHKDEVMYAHTDGFCLSKPLPDDFQFGNNMHDLKFEGKCENAVVKNCGSFWGKHRLIFKLEN